MQGHVYHWKHGWIPLDHLAARIKAKGSESGMHRYVAHYGIGEHRTGGERRTAERGQAAERRATDRGGFQYRKGTKTKDYPQRGFRPAGTGPQSADEAFRMKKPELEGHAASGNPHAQAELDRRAARKTAAGGKVGGKREGVPFRPTAGTPAAPKVEPRKPVETADDSSLGNEVFRRGGTVDADGFFRPGTASRSGAVPGRTGLAHHDDSTLGNEVFRRGGTVDANGTFRPGTAKRTAPKAPAAPKVAPKAIPPEVTGDVEVSAHTRSQAAAMVYGHGSPQHRAMLNAEDAEIQNNLNASRTVGHIGPHRVMASSTGTTERGGLYSSHHVEGKRRAVGQVSRSALDGPDAPFKAEHLTYTPKGTQRSPRPLGTFRTRMEAHRAIAAAEAAHQAKNDASVARKAARQSTDNAKRLEASARIAGNARTLNGVKWEPLDLEPGARLGNTTSAFHGKAVGSAKYAFQNGNKRVVIESQMAEHEVTGLLNDTSDVLERAGANVHHIPVVVRVPSADAHFRWSSNGGNVGGYVHRGGTVIHVNPVIARGEAKGSSFGHQHGGTHFMPANGHTDARPYVLTHELGHVIDGQNQHTVGSNPFEDANAAARDHHSSHVGDMGKYGRSRPSEGYAEAFAQHQLGGVGSHPVSDSYAARYGWHAPASKYQDATGKAQAIEARRAEFQAAWDKGVAQGTASKPLADATSTGAQLQDATRMTNAQKIDNAARMFGTGSRQHRAAVARFGN